jgi:hypothetical protein
MAFVRTVPREDEFPVGEMLFGDGEFFELAHLFSIERWIDALAVDAK